MSHIPEHYPAVSPFFIVRDAAGFIDFVKAAFGASELSRLARPDGVVMHAALAIEGSVIMVGTREKVIENSTHLYVKDVDATYRHCLELGATSISEPKTFPYGDRSAGVRDGF
jgi:uncharacterized glyoxalase superfamily protein PhnB